VPDTTSYDYDAPVTESGAPREKYFLFRNVIPEVTKNFLPPVPAVRQTAVYSISTKQQTASLWKNLPSPLSINSLPLPTMEDLRQSYGYVLYRTHFAKGDGGTLTIEGLHDYAQDYIDQKLVGTLNRRLDQNHLALAKWLVPAIDGLG